MRTPAGDTRISFRQGRTVNAWFWGCSLFVHAVLLVWLSTVEIARVVVREPSVPLRVTLLPAVPPPPAFVPSIELQPTIRQNPPVTVKAQPQPPKKSQAHAKPPAPRPPSSPVARTLKTQPTAPPLPVPTPVLEPQPQLLAESGDRPTLPMATASGSDLGHDTGAIETVETSGTADEVGNENDGHDEEPLPVSQVAEPPMLVSQVIPTYPPQARRWGVEGLVRLEAILNREGHVEEQVKVLESVPLLDDAASAALRQWRFTPARDHRGQGVRVILEVPLQFVLN